MKTFVYIAAAALTLFLGVATFSSAWAGKENIFEVGGTGVVQCKSNSDCLTGEWCELGQCRPQFGSNAAGSTIPLHNIIQARNHAFQNYLHTGALNGINFTQLGLRSAGEAQQLFENTKRIVESRLRAVQGLRGFRDADRLNYLQSYQSLGFLTPEAMKQWVMNYLNFIYTGKAAASGMNFGNNDLSLLTAEEQKAALSFHSNNGVSNRALGRTCWDARSGLPYSPPCKEDIPSR